jgi:hypothetical protein
MHFLKRNLIDITIFILLQYILTTLVLMYLYTGGNAINTSITAYVYNLNYLSDLGRVKYFSMHPNPFWFIYTLTMILTGIGTFLYLYLLSRLVKNESIRKIIIVLGFIAGLGYAFIGFFPVDINLTRHLTAGMTAFYVFIFANLLINFYINKTEYPYVFYATTLLNVLLIGRIMLILLIDHLQLVPVELLKYKVISQKIVIYGQVILATSILYYIKRKKIFYYENR